MSEIEKLMQKANVKKKWNPTPYGGVEEYYPEFTAEKQIELIKWLGELDYLGLMRTTIETKDWIFNSEYCMSGNIYKHSSRARTFEEALAKLINSIWQDLTEEEKQQVKGILE